MVLYCESGNSFVSARVAAALRKRGIQRIFILDGGLAAWKACGYPLSAPRDPLAELMRLGIQAFPPPWDASGPESEPISN
jgi:3-mercaptopyruvate sulfurtransferase SseA